MSRIRTTKQAAAIRPLARKRAAQKNFWNVYDQLFGAPGRYRALPPEERLELLSEYYFRLGLKVVAESWFPGDK